MVQDHTITSTVLETGDLLPYSLKKVCAEHGEIMAARNTGTELWYGLKYFSYGKGCLGRVQQALKDKAIELLVDDDTDEYADSHHIMGKGYRRRHGIA